VRCIIAVAALIGGTALLAEAQSSVPLRSICINDHGRAICARLSSPRLSRDLHQIQLQAPEISTHEANVSSQVMPFGRQPIPKISIRRYESIGLETLLPAGGLPATSGDVLDSIRQHYSRRLQAIEAESEQQESAQSISEDALALMDSLRADLKQMNDLAPAEPPDLTVDKWVQASSPPQVKGQLILLWKDMRDEYCQYLPGAKYVGLDSTEKHCKDPGAGPEKRAADRAGKLMESLSTDLSRILLQEQDHAKTLRCAATGCPLNEVRRLTTLSSSDPPTERIIQDDRAKWLEMRQVYCRYYHGAEYVDLDFQRQTCP
jgi:hypothetical protein